MQTLGLCPCPRLWGHLWRKGRGWAGPWSPAWGSHNGWWYRGLSILEWGKPGVHHLPAVTFPPARPTHQKSLLLSLFSHSVVSNSLRPHWLQHASLPCPSPTPGVYSNSCPSSRWCHPAISSSVVPFSSCLQSCPASGSFPMNPFFNDQSIGVSALAAVLPMNIQDWFPLAFAGWISLQPKGLSRVFSNTTVQKHWFLGAQLSSESNCHVHTWPLEKP